MGKILSSYYNIENKLFGAEYYIGLFNVYTSDLPLTILMITII